MIVVKGLIWDDWNKGHIAMHRVSTDEVEEVCHGTHEVLVSYRNRLLLVGETRGKRLLAIVLSPEDRNLEMYGNGIYYPITAFEKEVKK